MALTDLACKNTKPGPKLIKLSDGGGLQLHITPSGSRLWRVAYRFNGVQRKLAMGSYPEMSLEQARDGMRAAKAQLKQGIDPSQAKKLERQASRVAAENTFGKMADAFLAHKQADENPSPVTMAKLRWLLSLASHDLGKRPISEIKPPEILDVLRIVNRSGRNEGARRLRSVIGQVFRFAILEGKAVDDPTYALQGAIKAKQTKHRARITDPVQFGGLLRAIDGFDGQMTTRAALQLMALLFPRPGELRMAKWSEINWEAAKWVVPAERMKMRLPHEVPLPPQALKILRDLHEVTGRGELILPGYGSPMPSRRDDGGKVKLVQRPLSENTLNAALRRMGYDAETMTAHGFRGTASTILNGTGLFRPDVIEKALAHQERNKVRKAYNSQEYWPERCEMAVWWANHLDELREGGKVIPVKFGGGAR